VDKFLFFIALHGVVTVLAVCTALAFAAFFRTGIVYVCGVVWCGVMWCGVLWCAVLWCGVMWCGVMWCDVV
jgi:hypothetical protein